MTILEEEKIQKLVILKNGLEDGPVTFSITMCDCTGCDGGCVGNCYGTGEDPDDTWGDH